jgi:hypothetical protein
MAEIACFTIKAPRNGGTAMHMAEIASFISRQEAAERLCIWLKSRILLSRHEGMAERPCIWLKSRILLSRHEGTAEQPCIWLKSRLLLLRHGGTAMYMAEIASFTIKARRNGYAYG